MDEETWVQSLAGRPTHQGRSFFLLSPAGHGKTPGSCLPVSCCTCSFWSFRRDSGLSLLLSRVQVKVLLLTCYPKVQAVYPWTPQIGSKAPSDEESETRLTETEGIVHYSLAPFSSAVWCLPWCTEESLLSHRRQEDIIWWLATTKKCCQIVNHQQYFGECQGTHLPLSHPLGFIPNNL